MLYKAYVKPNSIVSTMTKQILLDSLLQEVGICCFESLFCVTNLSVWIQYHFEGSIILILIIITPNEFSNVIYLIILIWVKVFILATWLKFYRFNQWLSKWPSKHSLIHFYKRCVSSIICVTGLKFETWHLQGIVELLNGHQKPSVLKGSNLEMVEGGVLDWVPDILETWNLKHETSRP